MIRKAAISDISKIRILMQSTPGFWQPWWSDETVADAIQSSNRLAFVWEDRSQVLGFVCGHDLGFRGYLSELIVDNRVRRQGIGKRLSRAVEDALRRRGRRVLISDVWRDAKAFYGSLGWEAPDAILLRKRLVPADGSYE